MEGDIENGEDNIEVVELDDSRYKTHIHVPKKYLEIVMGTMGHTKTKIEGDTKTELKIPEDGQSGDINIFGPSSASVISAWRQINTIVVSSRMKQSPTHFISIPMNKPDIMDNFKRFQETVLRDCQSNGLEESIFIKPGKVHLTMGVMCLIDNEERVLASKLLREAKESVIMPLIHEHLPIKIKIKGLSYMDSDSKSINVLYAKVEEFESTPGVLQQLADSVVDYFNKKGLMKKQEFSRDSVKLHVTLLNTKYRSRSSQHFRSKRRRKPFDGTDILDKFGDFEFGVVELSEIHLSLRSATGPDGYYQPTFVVSVP